MKKVKVVIFVMALSLASIQALAISGTKPPPNEQTFIEWVSDLLGSVWGPGVGGNSAMTREQMKEIICGCHIPDVAYT